MLLRNLRAGPGNGLRNGTRLIILKLREKVIEAEITTGLNKGKSVLIPRITIAPSDSRATLYTEMQAISNKTMLCYVYKQGTRPDA